VVRSQALALVCSTSIIEVFTRCVVDPSTHRPGDIVAGLSDRFEVADADLLRNSR
jgi:hypothetical protein